MRSYTDEIAPIPPVVSTIPSGAGFGIRVLARLIDTIFGIILGMITGIFGGVVFTVMHEMGRLPDNWLEKVGEPTYWSIVFGLIGGVFYHGLAEGIGGTTLGKLSCGLNVMHLDGRPCNFLAAFKRSLAYLMDALFFGLVGWESMKKSVLRQRYGDSWGKTVVVKKSVLLPAPRPEAWKIAAGTMLGSAAWMAAQFAQMLAAVS